MLESKITSNRVGIVTGQVVQLALGLRQSALVLAGAGLESQVQFRYFDLEFYVLLLYLLLF